MHKMFTHTTSTSYYKQGTNNFRSLLGNVNDVTGEETQTGKYAFLIKRECKCKNIRKTY